MRQRQRHPLTFETIVPGHLYRRYEGPRLFGFSKQHIGKLIRLGKIAKPRKLTPGGRASGWTGQQIIDTRADLGLDAVELAPPPKIAPPKRKRSA
jgi:hypothetical protein